MGSLASRVQPQSTDRRKAAVNNGHQGSQDYDSDSDSGLESDLSSDSSSDSYSDTESDSGPHSHSDSDWDSEDDGKSPAFSLKTQGTAKGIYKAIKKHRGVSLISELVNDLSEWFL